MTLPANSGIQDNILQTDGNGVTAWADVPVPTGFLILQMER